MSPVMALRDRHHSLEFASAFGAVRWGVRQRNCIRAYAGTFGFYGELVLIAEVERHAKAQMRGFDKINRVPPSVS
jgi:hypothetical protein